MALPSAAPAGGPPDARPGAVLEVEHLTKRFGGVTAVDDVGFTVGAGEAVAVIGPNGAGKSSLLRLLSGIHRPTAGTVRFAGTTVGDLAPHAVAGLGIGLAHQIPRPFRGLSVRENITVGAMARHGARRTGPRRDLVESILDTCGLAAKAALPAGALPLLDLKRLELARALSAEPRLILLDEVAAGLNGRDLEEITELIRAVHARGTGLILVEHVEGVVASLVGRVLVLDWGRVIAEGTPAEVSADPLVRQVYLGAGHAAATPRPAAERPREGPGTPPLLRVESVTAAYGDVTALRDVSLDVRAGEIVAVLGANGAGKSTLAATVSGLVRPVSGRILLDGRDLAGSPSHVRHRAGIAHCPEGRKVFAELSVGENLVLPTPLRTGRDERRARLAEVHEIFPALAGMAGRRAGALSGGQQQMLAIGRALMSRPRLLVCDEISLGLAPVAIDALYEALLRIRDSGIAVVLVEQNVHRSLTVADRVHVLDRGRVSYAGDPGPLADPGTLDRFYFGASGAHAESARVPYEA